MALGIGGGGQAGLALEAVAGTYLAPTKFFRFNGETLTYQQATNWRRPLGLAVGTLGPVPGNAHVAGDVDLGSEALEDVIVYFLYASRATVVKGGAGPNYTYTFTPSQSAVPLRTMSMNIERVEDVMFGYTGLVVGSYRFGIADGMLTFAASMVGRDEATQAEVVATWPTTTPYGAGMFSIEIPTATPVTDSDTFEMSVEDNAEPQFRLKSTGRGAEFIKYGERSATLTLERDFLTRADYDAFKAYTSQSITLKATKSVNNAIEITMPVAYKDTYEVNLSGQGDLVRARIAYQLAVNPADNAEFTIVVKTQENIV